MIQDRNLYLTLGLFFGILLLGVWFAALCDSTWGEVAGALGSVVGGAIGALGAALAVYLTLTLNRDDEALRVSRAVTMEIASLSKFPSGQLDTCIMIHSGAFAECRRASLMTMMGTPLPVIYPSVAGQISRHPQVELIVAFFTGLQEAQAAAEVIAAATYKGDLVEKDDVVGLGVLLREQCSLAMTILSTEESLPRSSPLSDRMIAGLTEMLHGSINRANQAFPSLETYQQRTTPH